MSTPVITSTPVNDTLKSQLLGLLPMKTKDGCFFQKSNRWHSIMLREEIREGGFVHHFHAWVIHEGHLHICTVVGVGKCDQDAKFQEAMNHLAAHLHLELKQRPHS